MRQVKLTLGVVVLLVLGLVGGWWLAGQGINPLSSADRGQIASSECLVASASPNLDFSEGRPLDAALISTTGQSDTCVKSYMISGSAMEPNLSDWTIALFDTNKDIVSKLQRSDIIVFGFPSNPEMNMVKRIIGLPGDKVEIRGDQVYVNDQVIDEPYGINAGAITVNYGGTPLQLADDEFFVMGDNRPNSSDSRSWGPLKKDLIRGKLSEISVKFK